MISLKRIVNGTILLICLGLIMGLTSLSAQEKYPAKEIELVVGWSPGGGADVVLRMFGNELSKVLKVPVTILNKAGASGTVGAEYVRKAKKDGYTIQGGTLGWTLACATLDDVPHDPLKDFIPIAQVSSIPQTIFVKSDSEFKTLEDYISIAKKNPNSVTCGTAGPGSDAHLNLKVFEKAAGIVINHVPYKGASEVFPPVLGGHINSGIGTIPGPLPFLKAGKMRFLAHTGNIRAKQISEVPTFKEKGFTQTFFINWTGIWVPAGVPQYVIDTLSSASEKALRSTTHITNIENLGGSVEFMSKEVYRKVIEDEMKTAEAIALELGLKKIRKYSGISGK